MTLNALCFYEADPQVISRLISFAVNERAGLAVCLWLGHLVGTRCALQQVMAQTPLFSACLEMNSLLLI